MVVFALTTVPIGSCSRDPIGYRDGLNAFTIRTGLNKTDPHGTFASSPDFAFDYCRKKTNTPQTDNANGGGVRIDTIKNGVGVGTCGNFAVANTFSLLPGMSAPGFIMQHIKFTYLIVDCNLEFMTIKEFEHWEAFPIGAGQNEPEFDKRSQLGAEFHDMYADGTGQTRQCTWGKIWFEGSFKFFDFPVPMPPFQIGGCGTAGELQPCTTTDPSLTDERLVIPKGDSGRHNVTVTWDCCCPCCGYYRDWIGWPSY